MRPAGTGVAPRLLHLNGPPGIGKSTLAQRYVDERPGVLDLDVDRLRCLVGGWRDDFAGTGALVRPLAIGMAETHLRAGHDVVLPQYLGDLAEVERFAAAADRAGGAFVEVVLLDDRAASIDRFSRRGEGDADPWHDQVRGLVRERGGDTLLEGMYDRLLEVVARRPGARVVPTVWGEVEASYDAVCRAFEAAGPGQVSPPMSTS